MRTRHLISLLLLYLFLIYPAYSQGHVEVDLNWGGEESVSQGGSSYVTVIVTNLQDSPLTLRFVGLRFDWMDENTYIYGSGSEREYSLQPDDSTQYKIYFSVPKDTAPGAHSAFLSIIYTLEEDRGIEYHQIIEVKPGVHIMAVVTLTETEVVVVTVSEQMRPASSSQWPIMLSAIFGLTALAVVIVAIFRKRRLRR